LAEDVERISGASSGRLGISAEHISGAFPSASFSESLATPTADPAGLRLAIMGHDTQGGREFYILRCSTSALPEWEVARSYSEFQQLHKECAQLKMAMPPMPRKHIFHASSDPIVVQERLECLPALVQAAVEGPGDVPACTQLFVNLEQAAHHWELRMDLRSVQEHAQTMVNASDKEVEAARAKAAKRVAEAEAFLQCEKLESQQMILDAENLKREKQQKLEEIRADIASLSDRSPPFIPG